MPGAITVDHGTDSTSRALGQWAWQRGIELDFIRPGQLIENARIESFSGRLRDECLNVHEVVSLDEVRQRIEAGGLDWNHRRPHGSLGSLTPSECAEQGQEGASGAAAV